MKNNREQQGDLVSREVQRAEKCIQKQEHELKNSYENEEGVTAKTGDWKMGSYDKKEGRIR